MENAIIEVIDCKEEFVILPSEDLVNAIELSEINYMRDRMKAIQDRPGNPEGIEIGEFGETLCLYSETMPWGQFNAVKGLKGSDIGYLDDILRFYRERERKPQLEIVPSGVDQTLLKALTDRGFYSSAVHSSMYIDLAGWGELEDKRSRAKRDEMEPDMILESKEKGFESNVIISALEEDQLPLYATIHCRGTGLPDDGIPFVLANNSVLYNRPGWSFYLASVDGHPAAVGVMYRHGDVASLTFAATLPEFRKLGLHGLLLKQRLHAAREKGCKLVVGQCAFLSQSHRNMERAGMKIGYIRSTWTER